MEVDSNYDGYSSHDGLGIEVEATGREIRRIIAEQVHSVRRLRRPKDALLRELLVPRCLAQSTFQLPAVEKLLREFLPLEEAVNEILAPQINWAPPGYKPTDRIVEKAGARLWALRTDGDGDCLLHAVSLGLWGQHDRTSVLRSLVVEVLLDKPSEKILFRIWRDGQRRADLAAGGNASFEMEDDQVVAEWQMLVQAAKTPSAYLSSFHAFVLANALRRPIVVYGDRFVRGRDGEPYAPSDMRGMYLPTLLDPRVCCKVPITVGYTCVAVGKVGHFTALVGVDGELRHLPLVDEHGDDLPVRYGVDPASKACPDPEGDAMEAYTSTTVYRTGEGKRYRMAITRGAYMTLKADDIRRAMAHAAAEAFDRLARAQEEEINQQLEASSSNGTLPPNSSATNNIAEVGSGGGVSERDISPQLPSPPSAKPPPVTTTANGGLVVSRSGPDVPNDRSLAVSPLVDRAIVGAPLTSPVVEISAITLRGSGGNGDGGEGGGEAQLSAGRGGALQKGVVDSYDGLGVGYNKTGGSGRSVLTGTAGRGGGDSDLLDNDSSSASSRSEPTGLGGSAIEDNPGGEYYRDGSSSAQTLAADGTAKGFGEGEAGTVAPLASPPLVGRFLYSPLGVLSAVGAWATGRGKTSPDPSEEEEDAIVTANAARSGVVTAGSDPQQREVGRGAALSRGYDDEDETRSLVQETPGLYGQGGGDKQETAAGEPWQRRVKVNSPPPSVGGGKLMTKNGDTGASVLKIELPVHDAPARVDGEREKLLSRGGPGGDTVGVKMSLDSIGGMVVDKDDNDGDRHVATEIMDRGSPKGKRKPESSPAVTPDGPSVVRYFGCTDELPATRNEGVLFSSVAKQQGGAAGSRRSGRAAPMQMTKGGGDAAEGRIERGGSFRAEEHNNTAAVEKIDAEWAKAYHSTEKWRTDRASTLAKKSVGARRGQPHPREGDGQIDAALSAKQGSSSSKSAAAFEREVHRDRPIKRSDSAVGLKGYRSNYKVGGVSSNGLKAGSPVEGTYRSIPRATAGGDDVLADGTRPPRLPGAFSSSGGIAGASSKPAGKVRGEDSTAKERRGNSGAGVVKHHSRARLPEEWSTTGTDDESESGHVSERIDSMSLTSSTKHHHSSTDRQSSRGARSVVRSTSSGMYEARRRTSYPPSVAGSESKRTAMNPATTTNNVDPFYYRQKAAVGDGDSGKSAVGSSSLSTRRWASTPAPTATTAPTSTRPARAAAERRPSSPLRPRGGASNFDICRRLSPNATTTDGSRREGMFRSSSSRSHTRSSGSWAGGDGDGALIGGKKNWTRGNGFSYPSYESAKAVDGVLDGRRRIKSTAATSSVPTGGDPDWREQEVVPSSFLSGRRTVTPSPPPPPSWKSESLRRKLETPRSSTSSSVSSSLLSARLGPSSSSVPGAVARGGLARGRGAEGGGVASSTFEGQTLSSLRRSRAAQERARVLETGGRTQPRKTYSDTSKFY